MELVLDNYLLVGAALLAIAFGSICKGITGVGLPVLAVPMIASFTSVADAVVLMVLPGLASNMLVILTHRKWSLLAAHKTFLAAGIAGVFVGTWLLSNIGDRALKSILAVWLGIYLVRYFYPGSRRQPSRFPTWLAGVFGAAAGAMQGALGISASIVGPYVHARGLIRDSFSFVTCFAFFLFFVAQFAAVGQHSLLTSDRLYVGLMAIVPSLAFTKLGLHLAGSISDRVFNRLLILLFLLMELRLIIDIAGPAA